MVAELQQAALQVVSGAAGSAMLASLLSALAAELQQVAVHVVSGAWLATIPIAVGAAKISALDVLGLVTAVVSDAGEAPFPESQPTKVSRQRDRISVTFISNSLSPRSRSALSSQQVFSLVELRLADRSANQWPSPRSVTK